ncbi:MAG: nitroreductase family protein [Nitrososphaerales archaeon]
MVSLDVLEAIKTRRSISKFKPDEPPKELIEKILDAGTWAPTHHLTEPWKFFVLTGKAREKLGEAMAQALAEELTDLDSQENKARLREAASTESTRNNRSRSLPKARPECS